MATATATATITRVDNTQKQEIVYGTIAITASPDTYASGGLTVSLASDVVKSSSAPFAVYIQSAKAGGGSGYLYGYAPNASPTQANGKIQIFTSNGAAPAPLLEFTNATAIPAAVSGDAIQFEAHFDRV